MNQSQVIVISHAQTLHYTGRKEQKSTKTLEQRGTHTLAHSRLANILKNRQGHILILYKDTVHDTDTYSR